MCCVIGIDIGSTNVKVAAYDIVSSRRFFASRRMRTHHPQSDFSEYAPQEIWDRVCACFREILAKVPAAAVRAISVASMAEAGVPLDAAGKALYPFIAWFDPRTKSQFLEIEKRVGSKRIYEITGQYHHSKYGLNKLLWLRDNRPDIYAAIAKWLSMQDYIIYRLSGEFATDYSIASRTLMFDIVKRKWSSEILDRFDIPEALMPAVHPGGTAVGGVSRAAAAETGLQKGTAVVTGGQDHACAAIGVNIFEPGTILDSMGTAESALIAVAEPRLTPAAYAKSLCMYPHCGKLPYRVITSMQACGGSVEWFLARFGAALGKDQIKAGDQYEALMQAAARSPKGALGLIYMPHIRGLLGTTRARGSFVGIKDSHGFGDFARAIIEGVTLELRERIESCETIFESRYTKLKVVGGATRSDFWMQTKADLLGRRIDVPDNEEAASYGAALLAAHGAGIEEAQSDAARNFKRVKARYEPNLRQAQAVDRQYRYYKQVAAALLNIYSENIE